MWLPLRRGGLNIVVCKRPFSCSVNSVCVRANRSELSLGDTCYNELGEGLLGICQDSYCDLFGSKICEPFRAAGDLCTDGGQCELGVCNDYIPVTGDCNTDSDCRVGSCVEYSCAATAIENTYMTCSDEMPCDVGTCVDGLCEVEVLRFVGGECTFPADCLVGTCIEGVCVEGTCDDRRYCGGN